MAFLLKTEVQEPKNHDLLAMWSDQQLRWGILLVEVALHASQGGWWWMDEVWPKGPSARGKETIAAVSAWAGLANIQSIICQLNTKAGQNSFFMLRKLVIYGGDDEDGGQNGLLAFGWGSKQKKRFWNCLLERTGVGQDGKVMRDIKNGGLRVA